MLGVLGLQDGGCLGERAAAILLTIPLRGGDGREEVLHRGLVGEHRPVQVARIPLDQDRPEVEDHRRNGLA